MPRRVGASVMGAHTGIMRNEESAAVKLIPARPTIKSLAQAAAGCRACDLYRNATQTVFGEGAHDAEVMLVGEEPGDKEDKAGHPFVGPAGKLLDKALIEAGIDRDRVYITNAVKHFKWEPRGKIRLHKKPSAGEIKACRPWLDAEIAVLHPRAIVVMGSTAAQSLLGREFKVTQHRGEFLESPYAQYVTATIHPSAILRAPDNESRRAEMRRFVDDLKGVARRLKD